MALGPPLLSLQTLETLLKGSNDTNTQASHDADRRLKMAAMVYSRWTEGGKDEAVLAERYLDGAIDALDLLLTAGSCRADVSPAHQQQEPAHPCNRAARPSTTMSAAASSGQPDQAVQTGGERAFGMPAGIPMRHASQLTYDDFALQYMAPNLPLVIQGVTDGWAACQDWVDKEGGINLSFLTERFGDAQVWATECTSGADGYGGGRRHKMSLREYAAWWKQHKAGLDDRLLYLKDWHFVNEFPDYQAYRTPPFFRDDWLNQYYDKRLDTAEASGGLQEADGGRSHDAIVNSDYRFVYLGPAGTKTPLHMDVLTSFSWSVNVAGRKLWRLLPPKHTHLLYDRFGHELAPGFDADEARPGQFPNLTAARQHVMEVTQGTGEAIFVPSGWHHTVENLEDTLSINHNWLNGFNLHWAWELLQKEHAAASAAIEDCRATCSEWEYEALVQRNMGANCGMDFRAAGEFIASIALKDLQMLKAAGALEVAAVEGNSRSGACRRVNAQDSHAMPWSGEGVHRMRGMLLHSGQCQMSKGLEADLLRRDLRYRAAAKLRLKQALPMLEGLLGKVHCVGRCCSNGASEMRDRSADTLIQCPETGEHDSDAVMVAIAPAGCSSMKDRAEALPLSGNAGQWQGMNAGSFWQTLQQTALNIRSHLGEGCKPLQGVPC